MHPRAWLSKYRQTSIKYLTKMLLFYHGIGILLLLAGTLVVEQVINDYEEPSIQRSLLPVLSAGPIEETLFFGIPYYVFGNPYSVLVTGSIWAIIHILNTDTVELSSLAFGNLFFVLPSLFFSLRTWASGKGWFAIVTHSAWNGIFFTTGCLSGEMPCTVYDEKEDILLTLSTILLSVVLLGITYLLYKRKQNNEEKRRLAV